MFATAPLPRTRSCLLTAAILLVSCQLLAAESIGVDDEAVTLLLLKSTLRYGNSSSVALWPSSSGDSPPCSSARPWPGVSCELGAVTSLDLSGQGLQGPIPDALSRLTALVSIDLSNNSLTGTLPPSWSGLQDLEALRLDANALRGPLPSRWAALASLQELTAQSNMLTGGLPAPWGALSSLQLLDLSNNPSLGAPSPAGVSDTAASSSGSDPNRSGQPAEASAATGATGSKAAATAAAAAVVQGTLPASWARLSLLHTLLLRNTSVAGTLPAEWSALKRLLRLDLSSNRLTGTLPRQWAGASGLTVGSTGGGGIGGGIVGGGVGVSGSGTNGGGGGLASLRQLDLSGNGLQGALPPAWSGLAALQQVSLSSNQLTGTVPDAWGALRSLARLQLTANARLCGPLPAVLLPAVTLGPAGAGGTLGAASGVPTGAAVEGTLLLRECPWAKTGGILQNIRSTLRDPSSALAAWQPGTNPCSATAPWPGVICTAPSGPTTPAASAGAGGGSRRSAAATALPPSDAVGNAPATSPATGQEATTTTAAATNNNSNDNNTSTLSNYGSNSTRTGGSALAQGLAQAMWVSLSLPGLGLVGTLPGQLALLGDVLLDLDLGGNQLGGTLPSSWSTLGRLRRLAVPHNDLTGPLPPAWSALTALSYLDLSYNKLAGTLPPDMAAGNIAAALADVDLSTNAFTGPLPASWSALGALTSLYADSNALTGPLPPQWGALGALQELGLGRNALRGSVPAEWGRAMRSLRYLSLTHNTDLCGVVPPLGGTGPGATPPRLDSAATQLGAQCPDVALGSIKASSVQLWAAAAASGVGTLVLVAVVAAAVSAVNRRRAAAAATAARKERQAAAAAAAASPAASPRSATSVAAPVRSPFDASATPRNTSIRPSSRTESLEPSSPRPRVSVVPPDPLALSRFSSASRHRPSDTHSPSFSPANSPCNTHLQVASRLRSAPSLRALGFNVRSSTGDGHGHVEQLQRVQPRRLRHNSVGDVWASSMLPPPSPDGAAAGRPSGRHGHSHLRPPSPTHHVAEEAYALADVYGASEATDYDVSYVYGTAPYNSDTYGRLSHQPARPGSAPGSSAQAAQQRRRPGPAAEGDRPGSAAPDPHVSPVTRQPAGLVSPHGLRGQQRAVSALSPLASPGLGPGRLPPHLNLMERRLLAGAAAAAAGAFGADPGASAATGAAAAPMDAEAGSEAGASPFRIGRGGGMEGARGSGGRREAGLTVQLPNAKSEGAAMWEGEPPSRIGSFTRLVASLVSRRGGSGGGSRGSQYPTHPQSHYGEAPADGATNATATTTATVRSSSALLEAINSPRPLHTAQPRSPMFTSRGAGSSPRLRHIARDGQGAGSDREADDMAAAADLYRALVGGGAKDGYAGELEREQLEGEGREQGDADFFAAVGAAASGGRSPRLARNPLYGAEPPAESTAIGAVQGPELLSAAAAARVPAAALPDPSHSPTAGRADSSSGAASPRRAVPSAGGAPLHRLRVRTTADLLLDGPVADGDAEDGGGTSVFSPRLSPHAQQLSPGPQGEDGRSQAPNVLASPDGKGPAGHVSAGAPPALGQPPPQGFSQQPQMPRSSGQGLDAEGGVGNDGGRHTVASGQLEGPVEDPSATWHAEHDGPASAHPALVSVPTFSIRNQSPPRE